MSEFDGAPPNASSRASITSGATDQWAWLDALGRSLSFGAALFDTQATLRLVVGEPNLVEALRNLTAGTGMPQASLVWNALESNRPQTTSRGGLHVLCRRLDVDQKPVGAMLVAADGRTPEASTLGSIDPWLSRAVEAHLGQRASDDQEEAFDRMASLTRLLHDGVEGGQPREVVTAFAEAVFAWDGVEAFGFVEDVHGQWTRAMSPPGNAVPDVLDAEVVHFLRSRPIARLGAAELSKLQFRSDRHVVAISIGDLAPEPWVLVFAEGYRPLNLPRLRLYADLFRDALARLSGILETRAAWAVLQTLLGAGDRVDMAVDAALREFSRVVDGLTASLIVTNATGTTLLAAGDRDASSAVRPFDRGNRLVSTAHLPDHGTMQMAVRRARGRSFTRREQQLVDRAAAIFSAWLPGALKQPIEPLGAAGAARGFEDVLDRAASQLTRDGQDVSVVVIALPDDEPDRARLQSRVTAIRARLRGSDLAGAISDHEIAVLLAGAAPADLDIVCGRLGQALGLGVEGPSMGSASRRAGSIDTDSFVSEARRHMNGRGTYSGRRSLS